MARALAAAMPCRTGAVLLAAMNSLCRQRSQQAVPARRLQLQYHAQANALRPSHSFPNLNSPLRSLIHARALGDNINHSFMVNGDGILLSTAVFVAAPESSTMNALGLLQRLSSSRIWSPSADDHDEVRSDKPAAASRCHLVAFLLLNNAP